MCLTLKSEMFRIFAGKRSIILESQLPKGMERTIEKIAELEGLGAVPGQTSPEEDSGKPPEFITTPADLTLTENSLAHFECQLTPVNDSSMRVEWFHNGKPLSAGSRIKTINDFGFVILEVAGVYQRDSGLYTCKVFSLNINFTKVMFYTDFAARSMSTYCNGEGGHPTHLHHYLIRVMLPPPWTTLYLIYNIGYILHTTTKYISSTLVHYIVQVTH